MHVSLLSDTNWEAKIPHATRTLDEQRHFAGRDYGDGIARLIIVLNCRDPELGHRQRVRFTKATRTLGIDIMLPLQAFTGVPHQSRRALIADALLAEIPRILRKYSIADFDQERFLNDFGSYVTHCLLGPDADRFDHLCRP
jgi:hypothetical protein